MYQIKTVINGEEVIKMTCDDLGETQKWLLLYESSYDTFIYYPPHRDPSLNESYEG
jgi:hypothetical protein